MSFILPDLVIESILRDGIENARRDPSVIDDIFCSLNSAYAAKKYGQKEIELIKKAIQNAEISIVHAFNPTQSEMPCISIQLAEDHEDVEKAHMGNYINTKVRKFTDPDEIAATIVVENFMALAYNPLTGILSVPDSVNLGSVYPNLLLVDAAGAEFPIVGGIDNSSGSKRLSVAVGSEVAFTTPVYVKSSIDYEIFTVGGNVEQTTLILGVHSAEPLFTKYLYILVKYFTLSRRHDLTARGLQLNTYSGTDFTRNMEYAGDQVFTRYFHINGQLQNSWRADKVQLIDSVDITVKVAKDKLGNAALNRQDQTIKVTGDGV